MDFKVELPTTERSKLTVRDLNFYYGGFHALKHINLDIPDPPGRSREIGGRWRIP